MAFTEELDRLNADQRQAVDKIEGPLLVVAGPGTGKTQLLAMRVANILDKTDTPASAILCLTFTNKASTNMRSRILDLTDQKAVDVTVKTFHSFASEIMSVYPDNFWNSARLSLAPDTLQLEVVQSILSSLDLDNPLALKFAGQYTLTKDVIEALKLAKEAGLSPDKLRSLIELNLAYIEEIESQLVSLCETRLSIKKLDDFQQSILELPIHNINDAMRPLISLSTTLIESLEHAVQQDSTIGKTTNTSAWKRRWIQTIDGKKGMHHERDRNMWWLALADVYGLYRQQLHLRGYYDYADMLVEVISELEQNPTIRADLQERFLYVMIDEFQDTNPAQMRLAHLVADHHSNDGNPNLMAVGDDDQSIFKFNGAELNNMLSFRRSYPSSELIVLRDNYRSTQSILDTAKRVIDTADDRLVTRDHSLDKNLVARAVNGKGREQLLAYNDRDSQLSEIARMIASKYSSKRSIAVIARGHSSLKDLASRLIALNIPVHYEQQRNILDHPVVNQALLIADILEAIKRGDKDTANYVLSDMLPHPMWGLSARELWELATKASKNNDWMAVISKNKNTSWIADLLLSLAQNTADLPLGLTMEYLLGLRQFDELSSPIKEFFSEESSDKAKYLSGLSAIQHLRRMADEYSPASQSSMADLIGIVRVERDNDRVLTDESPLIVGSHGVHLLTVHKAKGLEFDDVYVIDAIEKNWSPRSGGRKAPANLPLRPPGDDADDYVRLMYVAVTRAKSNLTVSYYQRDTVGNEVLPSHIIRSALQPRLIKSSLPIIDIINESLRWPDLPQSEMKQALAGRLNNYSLSVTHLLNFLDVTKGGPQYFLERNLLRLPEPKSTSLAHGTAVHDALELAQRLLNTDAFDLEGVKREYISSLENQHLPPEEYRRYIKHGPRELERLFSTSMLQLKKGAIPEQRCKDVPIGTARLNGTLDTLRIGLEDIIITDYKTGRPLSSFDTKDKNQQIKAYKHRLQLIYYALLIRRSPIFVKHRHKRIVGQIVYVEATDPKNIVRSYEPTEHDIAHLERLILAVWRRITTLDLPDISKYSDDINGLQEFEAELIREATS